MLSETKDIFNVKIDDEIKEIKNSEIPIMDLASTGSVITKKDLTNVYKVVKVIKFKESKKEEVKEETPEPGEVKELTIDDFLDDFKL